MLLIITCAMCLWLICAVNIMVIAKSSLMALWLNGLVALWPYISLVIGLKHGAHVIRYATGVHKHKLVCYHELHQSCQ